MKIYIVSGIFLLLGSLIGTDAACKSSPCYRVEVYYESMCGDSMYFIVNELGPSYPALKDHLDVTFVPYGKATHKRDEENAWEFSCQHGNNECNGNMAQACALHVIEETSASGSKQELSVNLVNCVMATSFPPVSVPRCIKTIGLSESAQQKIFDCIQSSAGKDLLAAHGDKTHSLPKKLRFVPSIYINGDYSASQPGSAFENFKGTICDLLKGEGKDLESCA